MIILYPESRKNVNNAAKGTKNNNITSGYVFYLRGKGVGLRNLLRGDGPERDFHSKSNKRAIHNMYVCICVIREHNILFVREIFVFCFFFRRH